MNFLKKLFFAMGVLSFFSCLNESESENTPFSIEETSRKCHNKHKLIPEITNVSYDSISDVVKISWNKIKKNNLIGFSVYRKIKNSNHFIKISTEIIRDTSFIDSIHKSGCITPECHLRDTVFYKVRATYKKDKTYFSSPVKVVVPNSQPVGSSIKISKISNISPTAEKSWVKAVITSQEKIDTIVWVINGDTIRHVRNGITLTKISSAVTVEDSVEVSGQSIVGVSTKAITQSSQAITSEADLERLLDVPKILNKDTTLPSLKSLFLRILATQNIGTFVRFKWDFNGTGIFDSTSIRDSASFIYTTTGQKNVRLYAEDDDGNITVKTIPIIIATFLSGNLLKDSILSLSTSPYLVDDDYTVSKTFTLTINQGVDVRVNRGKSIVNNGVIIARGSIANRIRFIPDRATGNKGEWKGIKVSNGGSLFDGDGNYVSGSMLSNIVVEGADTGLFVDTSLALNNVEFNKNNIGIEIKSTPKLTLSNANFASNKTCISVNKKDASLTRLTNVAIRRAIFDGNEAGIKITSVNSNYLIQDMKIDSCEFNETLNGIVVGDSSFGPIIRNLFIRGNSFIGNNRAVNIASEGSGGAGNSSLILRRNKIFTSLIGIQLNKTADLGVSIDTSSFFNNIKFLVLSGEQIGDGRNNVFMNNDVEFNNFPITMGSSSSQKWAFTKNVFFENIGPILTNTSSTLDVVIAVNNNISSSSPIIINNTSRNAMTAINNYWIDGITVLTTLTLPSRIIDFVDNVNFGLVTFSPISVTPVSDAGNPDGT